jgi:hypothetical protein
MNNAKYEKRYREAMKAKARKGEMRCGCGNVAVDHAHGSAVCQRCKDIESKLSWHYGRATCGKIGGNARTDYYLLGGNPA